MLTISDTGQSAIMKLAGGNPGAIRVCCEVLKCEHGIMDLLHMDDMGMRGSSIWIGFKDFAGEDLPKFRQALKDRDPDMVRVITANGGQAWTGGRS